MKLFDGAISLFSAMARFFAKTSLRGIVLILGLVIVLSSWRPFAIEKMDALVFQLSTWLMEAPRGSPGIVIIEIPQIELETWQSDINQAGKLGALLSNILHSKGSVVGLVLERPIDARTASADKLLDRVAKLPVGKSDVLAKTRELTRRKGFLLEYLRNERVVVGVYDRRFPETQAYEFDWGVLDALPEELRHWLWSRKSLRAIDLPGSVVKHYPIYRAGHNQRVLIDESESNTARAGFILRFLGAEQRLAGVEQAAFLWRRDSGLQLGSLNIATSPAGAILPVFGSTQRMTPAIDIISLDEAMARGSFPARVYVSGEKSVLAYEMALAAYSIENGMTVYSPWWYAPLEKLLMLVLTLYLVLLLPRLSSSTGLVLSVFVVFLVLVVQIIAQATQKLWLPFSMHLVWLSIGYMLVLMWSSREKTWKNLVFRADEACIDQSRSLIDRGDLEAARKALEPCTTHDRLLTAMYDISNAFASKRQYRQAIDVLKNLRSRKKNYRDIKEKIAVLQSMLNAGGGKNRPANHTVESTVILNTPQIEKPVLGRYEIREELGRGAMGTVYLAFDPKIARQVAIKTLNYNQFQGPLLEEIKSRFFREAEAAGRLSHPNIVSVFDVGEEHDLAFIAMDFAEGKPLNEFVHKKNLLPMFEVYRIVCDVALALEYAHTNQIVHRDVKPGNIMYSPSPYQLKVTDFGIARLVDNSKTSTGEILGSPLYMAPEQLKGKKVNQYADIFSLGVTFYQLLTGQLPFQGENLASLTYEIIHGKFKGVKSVRKDLPSSAARIVNQALQKTPEDRYSSAAEMALVLKKAIKRDFAHEAKRSGYL